MNLSDLLSTIKDTLIARWEEFQESPVYAQLKERYESLSPIGQKSILWVILLVFLSILYMIPNAFLSSADDAIAVYDEKKEQAQELLEVSQASKTLPPLPPRLDAAQLKTAINSRLQEAGLAAEQIKNVVDRPAAPQNSLVPTSVLQNLVNVELRQLNLKQIVDIEFQLSKISPLVKVVSLDISAFATDNHYYDVMYTVASFNVKETEKDSFADVAQKAPKGRLAPRKAPKKAIKEEDDE